MFSKVPPFAHAQSYSYKPIAGYLHMLRFITHHFKTLVTMQKIQIKRLCSYLAVPSFDIE